MMIHYNLNKLIYELKKRLCWVYIWNSSDRRRYRFLLKRFTYEYEPVQFERLNDAIQQHLEKNHCICVLPASLGDTLLFFEYKQAIEKYYSITCFPIIKKSHEIIAKLCQIEEYALADDMDEILLLPAIIQRYEQVFYSLREVGLKNRCPTKASIFVAHSDYLDNMISITPPKDSQPFLYHTCVTFGLPKETTMEHRYSLSSIPVTNEFSQWVILAPESATLSTTRLIPIEVWIKIAQYYQNQGYHVVYNAINPIHALDRYALWLNESLERVLYMAKNAHLVVSLRSGLCDLLHPLQERLVVIYPNHEFLKQFSTNEMFSNTNNREIVYKSSKQILETLTIFK